MGCYENVKIPCPQCGEEYWAQSKSGPCEMGSYTLKDAPDEVIADVNRHAPFQCECGALFSVELTYPKKLQVGRKVIHESRENY